MVAQLLPKQWVAGSNPVSRSKSERKRRDLVALLLGLFLYRLTSDLPADQVIAILNAAPSAAVGSDGSFAFAPVPQCTYDLAWGFPLDSSTSVFIQVFNPDGSSTFVATVGPLCPFDFGTISTPFIPSNLPLSSSHIQMNTQMQELVVHQARLSMLLRG